MNMLYIVMVLAIVLWLALVFNALVGLRIVVFPEGVHSRVHQWISFALIVGGLVNGFLAMGTLFFGWFY